MISDKYPKNSANDFSYLINPKYQKLQNHHNQLSLLTISGHGSFHEQAQAYLAFLARKVSFGELAPHTLRMAKSRVNNVLIPYFSSRPHPDQISLEQFIDHLIAKGIQAITAKQYLGLIKRILKYGLKNGLSYTIPHFPEIRAYSNPRGSFSISEYRQILRASREIECVPKITAPTYKLRAGGVFIKSNGVPHTMRWLIQFMVNTFIRPVDIKLIQHHHIEIINNGELYLRITLPETKRHRGQVISMRAAVGVYERIRVEQISRGWGRSNDYVFFPEVKNRQCAISLISSHFRKILNHINLRQNQEGQNRTLYSLRHTAITFRLLYGQGIDLLTLARNARTSVEMIEKFYASNLSAEMNVNLLQSKRTSINRITKQA